MLALSCWSPPPAFSLQQTSGAWRSVDGGARGAETEFAGTFGVSRLLARFGRLMRLQARVSGGSELRGGDGCGKKKKWGERAGERGDKDHGGRSKRLLFGVREKYGESREEKKKETPRRGIEPRSPA